MCAAVEVKHLSLALGHTEWSPVWAHMGTYSRAGTEAALQRQGRVAESQQEEKRQTQGLALRADLTDTDLFPHEKLTEISAP